MGLPSAASVRVLAAVGPAARVKSGSRMERYSPGPTAAGAGPRLLSASDVRLAQGRGEIVTPGEQDQRHHDGHEGQQVDDVGGDVDVGELERGGDRQADAEDEGRDAYPQRLAPGQHGDDDRDESLALGHERRERARPDDGEVRAAEPGE